MALVVDGVAGERWLLKTSSEASDMDRYEYVARQVMGIIFGQDSNAVVELVAVEGVYASRNLITFARLVSLQTVVLYALHRSQVPYLILPPTAWRKILFGPKSQIDKERLRVATFERLAEHLGDLDVVKVDLNVLEAVLIALAAWKVEQNPSLAPTPKRRKRAASAA